MVIAEISHLVPSAPRETNAEKLPESMRRKVSSHEKSRQCYPFSTVFSGRSGHGRRKELRARLSSSHMAAPHMVDGFPPISHWLLPVREGQEANDRRAGCHSPGLRWRAAWVEPAELGWMLG